MFSLTVDEQIELQLFQPHHANELYRLVNTNRWYLRQWLPWVDHITSPADYHALIPMWLKQFAENNGFHAGIRYNRQLVGTISLSHIDWPNSLTTIGYYLSQDAQGKGVMARATAAVLDYVFYHLKINRVEIRCGTGNQKSQAIPIRLGFTMEGIIRDGESLNGQFHDLLLYSMLSREWSKKIQIPY